MEDAMTEECTLEFKPDGRAHLLGALTFNTSTRLYRTMQGHLDSGRYPAEIDLAGVSTVDSAGLALLLEWQSICKKAGKPLAMNGAPDSLLELARLCGAEKRLQLNGREAA
jgi:phospholipid transport system transporter-binding protein